MTWAPPAGPFAGTLTGIVVASGDSIMAGANGADSTFNDTVLAPFQSFANANPSCSVYSNAQGGYSIDPYVIAGASFVDGKYNAARQFNIHWLWAATNDLYLNGTSPAALLDALKPYANLRRAAGLKFVMTNCLERNSLDPAKVATWNALILAHWQEFADAPPIDAHTICGPPAQADQTHISTAQGAAVAAAAETVFRGLI